MNENAFFSFRGREAIYVVSYVERMVWSFASQEKGG